MHERTRRASLSCARSGTPDLRGIALALSLTLVLTFSVGCDRRSGESGTPSTKPVVTNAVSRVDATSARASLTITGPLPDEGGVDGFTGSESCRVCHADQHATWHRSFHRTMTQAPGTNSILADFEGVILETPEERWTLSRNGNEFWAAIDDLAEWRAAAADRKPSPVRVRIGLVTGSHHMQAFWLPAGFGNAQIGFPFTWLIDERRWAPRHDVFLRDPKASTPVETWNMTCIRCHSTGGQPRPRKDADTFETRVVEQGISCEACHGPGSEHVSRMKTFEEARRANPSLALPSDLSIIQPEHLDKARRAHVCAQCHGMKWFDAKEDWVEHGFRFRPGEDLESTTPIIRPTRIAEQPWMHGVLARSPDLLSEFFWGDGMIRVAGREYNGLVESACFQKGDLTCLSCHSLHGYVDRDDQLKSGMDGNAACISCHDGERYGPAHSRHSAGSSGALCYNCHMPHTTYALLKGIRQHQIDSPRAETTLATGRPNACNICHQDRSLAWTAERLASWYGHSTPDIPDGHRGISAVARALLAGDAGQRALAAWQLGWEPARELTGSDWQVPLLTRLLEDPYAAVRHIARRSLARGFGVRAEDPGAVRSNPGLPESGRRGESSPENVPTERTEDRRVALLLGPSGNSDSAIVEQWLRRRDDRPVHLRE